MIVLGQGISESALFVVVDCCKLNGCRSAYVEAPDYVGSGVGSLPSFPNLLIIGAFSCSVISTKWAESSWWSLECRERRGSAIPVVVAGLYTIIHSTSGLWRLGLFLSPHTPNSNRATGSCSMVSPVTFWTRSMSSLKNKWFWGAIFSLCGYLDSLACFCAV